jgi:lipopolysaccharide biosynthesis glycosyltransferase
MDNINIAFCFDERLWMQAGVAIASLLINSKGKCRCDIYCVVPKNVTSQNRKDLRELTEIFDADAKIFFLEANNDFDNAKYGGFYISSFYRLMLPVLLPSLDKILYLDSDTLVCGDLLELYGLNLEGNFLAGVRDVLNYKESRDGISSQLGYINAGILLFNLKLIREEKLYDEWVITAKIKTLKYFDQDILNLTCQNRIIHLPLKYNYFPRDKKQGYRKSILYGVHSLPEFEEAYKNPVIYHFIHIKPWNRPAYLSNIWWRYAKQTPFYTALAMRYIAGNLVDAAMERDIKKFYLFGFLPVLTMERDNDKLRYKLFGLIPLLKIRCIKE